MALFLTAKAVTQTGEEKIGQTAIFQDPTLVKPAEEPRQAELQREGGYAAPLSQPRLEEDVYGKPVAAAFLGGNLDYSRLNLFERLFVKRIVGAEEGDPELGDHPGLGEGGGSSAWCLRLVQGWASGQEPPGQLVERCKRRCSLDGLGERTLSGNGDRPTASARADAVGLGGKSAGKVIDGAVES